MSSWISSGASKAESGEVADVQLDDVVAFVLHLLRLLQHGAANVVADVVELVRFEYRFHRHRPRAGHPS
jgi:hypothetical protein